MAFGTSLPARIPTSTGTNYYVAVSGGSDANDGSIGSPWATIQKAFDTVSTTGSIINLRGGTHAPGSEALWSRAGNSSNPVTIRAYPGETAIVTTNRIRVNGGSYIRFSGIEFTSGVEGIKCDTVAHHIDIEKCTFHDLSNHGILLGGGSGDADFVQVWNSVFYNIGDGAPAGQDHGIYMHNGNDNVVANCIFYNILNGYGIQVYPGTLADIIITCCVFDGFDDGGPVVLGDDSGPVSNVRIVACIGMDNASGVDLKGFINPFGATISNINVQDTIGFNLAAPIFPVVTGVTYTNTSTSDPVFVNAASRNYRLQGTSPAINFVNSARDIYMPATDIDGISRVTRDAGAYAYIPPSVGGRGKNRLNLRGIPVL